jgi:hypothetical protein
MARRIRSFEMNGNAYFTSSRGILKSTTASAELEPAGMPRALDMSYTMGGAGTGTIFTAASQYRAYRQVWGKRDDNNNLVLGAPSGRLTVVSGAINENATLTLRIPPQVTTDYVYQIYATSIGTTDPGDSMVLTYEASPTAAQIAAGTIAYEDKIPDAFRNVGTPLYTNADQEGAAAANNPPPLARDVCEFRGFAFYANYTDPHRMTMQLVDAASLVAGTSTLTIGGIVFTANAAETISTGTFQKYTAGTAAANVEDTAKSLVRVINGYAANTQFYATYVSTPTTVPGKILIEERSIGGSAFTVVANNSTCGNCFVPPIPTSGSAYTSIAERRRNRIRVSKLQQAEHVPIARDLIVGAEYDEIQRIIPLQDMVIVIKDRTIWRITGSAFEDFLATIHDDTCSIAGRDSAAKLNNTVFALSNQGFIAINGNGVQIVGRPEEHRVLAGLEALQAPDHDEIVGVGVEVKRMYLCKTYDAAASASIVYCYNAITRQWSRWKIDPSCFAVVDDRVLYGLDNSKGHVLLERASRRDGDPQYRDMCDEAATFVVSAIDSTAKTITGTFTAGVDYTSATYTDGIGYGWKLYDGSNQYLVLSANGSTLTLNTVTGLSGTPTLTAYRPIPVTVEWNPITGGNPGELKQWGDITIRCETQNAYKVSLSYANEYDRKTDPASTTWVSQPSAIDAYVSDDQTKASASNNDFDATAGNVNPNNVIVSKVAKDRAVGYQLQPKIYHSVAEARLSIKALVVDARPTGSPRGHQ